MNINKATLAFVLTLLLSLFCVAQQPLASISNSKIYHLPGCSGYSKVSEKNQVKFDNAADAEQAGYKLAGNCSPNKNQSNS